MIEKHYDYTPYAYVYNNPMILIDPTGMDSVIVHVGTEDKDKSSKDELVKEVTFSVKKDGNETPLEIDEEGSKMYMFSNREADKKGYNALPDKEYPLKFDQMSKHNGEEDYENTIRIYEGVFGHPGKDASWFGGCKGFTSEFVAYGEGGVSVDFSESVKGLQQIRTIYDKYDKQLTGSKLILRTNSTAKPPAIPKNMKAYQNEGVKHFGN